VVRSCTEQKREAAMSQKTLEDIDRVFTRDNGSILVTFKDGSQRIFASTRRMQAALGGRELTTGPCGVHVGLGPCGCESK